MSSVTFILDRMDTNQCRVFIAVCVPNGEIFTTLHILLHGAGGSEGENSPTVT